MHQNQAILQRLIHMMCHVREQELVCHGHNESDDSLNWGSYVEPLGLVSEFDPLLCSIWKPLLFLLAHGIKFRMTSLLQ